MTEKEAIGYLECFEKWNEDDQWLSKNAMKGFVECCTKALKKIQQYRAIGTVEECWAAREKQKHMNDGWIPVEERLPKDSNYILLSFANFSLPLVGRYEDSQEDGAFYVGDCDGKDSCINQDLVVNAWQPLPDPYRPE